MTGPRNDASTPSGLRRLWKEVRVSPVEVVVLMLLVYGGALGMLWHLRQWGWVEFGFYGIHHEPVAGFLTLILVYLLTLPLVYLCPDRHLTGLLLLQGAGFTLLVFSPVMAAALFGAAVMCFTTCTLIRRFWVKAVVLTAILLLPAAGLIFRGEGAKASFPLFGLAFAMMAGFKVFLFAFETHTRRRGYRELPRFLVYLFLAPNLVIPPYHVVIPGYGAFWKSLRRTHKADVALHGLSRLGWALLDAGLLVVVGTQHEVLLRLAGNAWLVALHLRFLELYLGVATAAHMVVALANGLGFDLRPAMRMPYLSRGFLEFLNRFVPYFKDWMATLFYYPLVMHLRKKMRAVPLQFLAIVNALVVGNTAAHLLRYVYSLDQPEHRARLFEVSYENILFSGAIALYFVVWKPYEACRDRLVARGWKWLDPAAGVLERCVTVTLFAWLFFFSLGA